MSCLVRLSTLPRVSRLLYSLLVLSIASFLLPGATWAQTFPNSGSITINQGSGSTLPSAYPTSSSCTNAACITVSGLTGSYISMSIKLTYSSIGSQSFSSPAILLVSPDGAHMLDILSFACGTTPGSASFTLEDSSANGLFSGATDCPSPLAANYQAADYITADNFPTPGPGSSGYSMAGDGTSGSGSDDFNSVFGSLTGGSADASGSLNGTWKLYAVDQGNEASVDGATIISGWSLTFSTTAGNQQTDTALSAGSPNPSFATSQGNDVSFTATVTLHNTSNPVPDGGTVTLYENSTNLGSGTISGGNGKATISTTLLSSQGTHEVYAVYNPSTGYATSTSSNVPQTVVNHATATFNGSGTSFCNSGSISLSSSAPGSPYPEMMVLGHTGITTNDEPTLPGTIESLSVSLNGISLSNSEELADLGFALQAPGSAAQFSSNGNSFEFLSWGGNPYTSGSLTISDTGSNEIPYDAAPSCTGSICLPTDNSVDVSSSSSDAFPSPGPASPDKASPTGSATFATEFGGGGVSGTWSLYVDNRQSVSGSPGSIGSWCLNITTQPNANATTTTVSGSPNPASFSSGTTATVTLTANVSSAGFTVNAGNVTFVDGATDLGSATVSGGVATLNNAALGEGSHQIVASYSGTNSGTIFGISSAKFDERVDKVTTIPASGTGAGPFSYCNSGPITAPGLGEDSGAAYPYPSNISVSNLPGTVKAFTFTLKGFKTFDQGDLMSLLVGPSTNSNKWNNNYDFFSLTGSSVSTTSAFDLTFADGGTSIGGNNLGSTGSYAPESNEDLTFPQCGQNVSDCGTANVGPKLGTSSTFTPTNTASPKDVGTTIMGNLTQEGVFGGTTSSTYNGNGTWSLYLDDGGPSGGGEDTNVTNGWCVNLTVNLPSISLTPQSDSTFTQSQTGTFPVTITNNGAGSIADPTQTTGNAMTVTDTLPTGLTFNGTPSPGTDWSCSAVAQVVTCTNKDSVAANAEYNALTINVNVSPTASGPIGNNTVAVSDSEASNMPTPSSAAVTIDAPPVITSGNSTTFTVGTLGTFTVTTTGYPAPSLSETGALPSGVTFADNGDGTAKLSGTPAAGTGGTYTLTITASNGIGTDAQQSYTLTVNQSPAVTSASSTTFTAGSSGSFTVTTSGFPASTITKSGSLPIGVTFTDNHDGTATLGGTPAVGGSFPITITASNGVSPNGTQSFALTVNKASTSSSVVVDDAATSLPWGGSETAGAQAYGTASVSTGSSSITPTGTVTYTLTSGSSCTGTVVGTSTVSVSSGIVPNSSTFAPLGAGVYGLSASYSGDSAYLSSTSSCAAFTVAAATPTVTVTSSPNPSYFGQSVGISAVLASGYNPAGNLVFTSNGGPIAGCTISVSGNGTYTCTTTALALGTDAIVATYSGDANNNSNNGTLSGGQLVNPPPILVVNETTDTDETASNCVAQTTAGTTTNGDACTLRDALLESASIGSGNISFDSGVFTTAQTITLGSAGTLNIPANTTITGPTSGSGSALTNLITVNGNNASTVFTVSSGVPGTSIANLIVTNGSATNGGGISNAGTLTVIGSTISGNNSGLQGAGIYNAGTLTVTSSTISGNSGKSGGGIDNESAGSVVLTDVTITGNTAGFYGGGILNSSTLNVSDSTISGNFAGTNGAGIYGFSGTITVSNTILDGDQLGSAGSPGNYDDLDDTTGNTTFSGNDGGNLIGYYNANSATAPTPAANLAPLASYGGPTQTMVPLPGSAAICAATLANVPSGTTTDQRGYPLQPTGGYCASGSVDIGAVQTNYTSVQFVQQPTDVAINADMSPAPTVEVLETNTLVISTDAVGGVSVTVTPSGGTYSGSPFTAMTSSTSPFLDTLSSLNSTSTASGISLTTSTIPVTGSFSLSAVASGTYNVTETAAAVTLPVPNSVLAGPKVPFTWSSAPGATAYKLWIGTSPGTNNLYTSGPITSNSTTPTLPANGQPIYVTLVTVYGPSQVQARYTYTAATPAALTSPAPNTVIAGPLVPFTWSAAPGAVVYKLWIGTSAGKNDLFTSGQLKSTTATPSLPTNGETIYVTLITIYDTGQVTAHYTLTAATPAALSAPAASSVLAGPAVPFTWSAAPGVTAYKLWIGSSAGKNDLYTSGPVTTTSATAVGLPANGETVYATLVTIYQYGQLYNAYSFTSATQADLTSPTGPTLSGASVPFAWSAAPGATAYKLWVGTSFSEQNLYSSGPITSTNATATKLPTDGETLYVTLVTIYGSNQVYAHYTFTSGP